MAKDLPLISYPEDCFTAIFIQRVKRFSVEVAYQGQRLWIHSNNSGSMLGLTRRGSLNLVSKATNPQRKLKFTQEAVWHPTGINVRASQGFWVGVNTSLPNKMLKKAFEANCLPFAKEYSELKLEVKCQNSRLDGLFTGSNLPDLFIECKNVTLVEDNCALFPDAKSERGCKHLQKLMEIAVQGGQAGMFYLVPRDDGKFFAPCDLIDEKYAKLFYQALAVGVKMYVYRAKVNLRGVQLTEPIPLAPRRAIL